LALKLAVTGTIDLVFGHVLLKALFCLAFLQVLETVLHIILTRYILLLLAGTLLNWSLSSLLLLLLVYLTTFIFLIYLHVFDP
jgi:hypothetical protein